MSRGGRERVDQLGADWEAARAVVRAHDRQCWQCRERSGGYVGRCPVGQRLVMQRMAARTLWQSMAYPPAPAPQRETQDSLW